MKAGIYSVAVLALLGHVSAINLKNSLKQQEQALVEDENRPDDTILLQTGSKIHRHHHRHGHHQGHINLAQGSKKWSYERNLDNTEGPWYIPAVNGTNWYELERKDERIHGSPRFESSDDQSPYDPDVVDAPEDIKRVGNDHEELHNAKLSPNGYYKGFFHKDHQGNYAQVKKHHKHGHHQGQLSMAQKSKGWSYERNLDNTEGPWYIPAVNGTNWYELERKDERIHGSPRFESSDDQSPYDPDVVDAPEDIKRVGNDHEELHNAKLSPNGYYKGFFHKDHQGNYAQIKKQHHHHGRKDASMVQVDDHDNDTDDIPYSYEADGIKAVPQEGQSDFDLLQTNSHVTVGDNDHAAWGAYLQHQANVVLSDQKKINDEMEQVYAQEEDEGSYEFLQLKSKFNHDEDTDDVAESQDPIELRKSSKQGGYIPDRQQLLAQKMEEQRENDAAEVQDYIQQQTDEDNKTLAEQTKIEKEKRKQEMEAEKTQKEREENQEINDQIDKFMKH